MAGSLEQRIGNLEKLYSIDARVDRPEGWREAMSASLERAQGRAAAEEGEGDLRRRVALTKLYKFLSGDEPHGG